MERRQKEYTNKFGHRGREQKREGKGWQEVKSPVPRVLLEFERNNSRVNLKTNVQERKYNSESEDYKRKYATYILSEE